MGHTNNTAAAPRHTVANIQSYTNRPAHSSTVSLTAANSHTPLSPYSATHSTFHHASAALTAQCPSRNPLTPSYILPTYPICTPPPPAFVHSSLDVSDIARVSTAQRRRAICTRDNINVHDIEGARPRQYRQSRRISTSRQGYEGSESTGLLHYMRPAGVVDAADADQPDDTAEPFSPHFASSSATVTAAAPASPPSRPRSSPPTTSSTAHKPAYRSPYTRFSHSPHVLTPPTIAFASLYHAAIPSTDTLPPFRYTLQRTSALPSSCAPLGGVDGSDLDEVRREKKQKWRRKRMQSVSARVQCWRMSEGEVERSAVQINGGEWQRMRVQDIELVSSLTL